MKRLLLLLFVMMAAASPPAQGLAFDGASSQEELVDLLLQALANRDESALHRLRVSEREYLEVIIPGTVPVGTSPRQVTPQVAAYFWQVLDTKNRDVAHDLIQTHGGKNYKRQSVRFSSEKVYAGYAASGPTEIVVTLPDGQVARLEMGSVARVGNRYKWIGLRAD